MMLKIRDLCLCSLVWLLGSITQASGAEKPQLFVLDTTLHGDSVPGGGSLKDVSDVLSSRLEFALWQRFKACTGILSSQNVRAMLGLEKQKALLGAEDASNLAEIGGALGRDGLLVRSSASIHSGSAELFMEVALLNLNTGFREGSSSATLPFSDGLKNLPAKVVDGLPDLCAPMWGGKVSVQYQETMKGTTRDESSDTKFFHTTDFNLGLESSIYILALSGETKQVSAEHQVSGAFKSASHRISEALCGGGERGGPERVVPDGYRESSYATSEFGPVLGGGEKDESGPSFGLQIYPQRGVYTLDLVVPGVRYEVKTQARHVLEECGKATTDVPPSIPSEQAWAGTRVSVQRGFKKGQTTLSGGDSHSEASPGRDGANTSTAYQWDLRSKPYIEYLMKKKKK